ncbi:MAG TPA: VCBS repeat-containing protein [Candidatus Dormibacteraeota bacterium]|nr:VCBS repeat-containing protein [Candidatus Dormibacteraeota bacterium]
MEHWGHPRARPGSNAALSLLLFILAASPASAQSSLKSRRDIGTGNHPVGAIAIDFDGDGLLDIVSVDQLDDSLGLVKGFGDGTFRRVKSLAVGSLPSAVAFTDTNGDGLPDLITANLRTQEVTVNLNDGHGGYGAKISSQVLGTTMSGMAVGDWNGDGKIDVAVIAASLNTLVTMTGDGAGHFGTPVQYTVGTYPKQVITADFNKDGKADLAVVNSTSASIQIWGGDGTGQFTLTTTLATGTGTQPQGLSAGDPDNDGDADLVVCDYGTDKVAVYLNNGSGGFGSPTLLSPGFGPRATVLADVNKDGKPDLFVTLSKVSGVGQAATLLGNGAGGFGAPSLVNTGPVPNTATLGDFNQDDNLDLVTVNLTGNTLSILLNTGSGAFILGSKVALASGAYPQGVVAADLNRDGRPDLASANQAPGNVSIVYGDGAGGFSAPGSPVGTGTTPSAIVAADYNHDGNVDLVTANNGTDNMTYLQGNGTSFANYNFSTGCTGPVSIATGDISGDLLSDLAVVCEGTSQLCTRRGTGASGNGAFGASVCTTLGGIPTDLTLGNFNGDAFADAAISFSALGSVSVALSNGAGGVSGTPVSVPVGLQPSGMASGDVTGDGIADIVVTNSGSNSITVLPGGAGGAPIESPAGLSPTALVLADFNMDGKVDAAVANTDDNNVSLLLGDGTGRFVSAGYFGTRDLPVALGAGDFNGDGKPDLAVADSFSDSLTILLNQSMAGDPLQWVSMFGGERNVFRWGMVPGAVYDVIRGSVKSIVAQSNPIDLGPVICVANDITETDTTSYPDSVNPAFGQAFFYLVRSVVGGVPGIYTVASNGKVGVPSSGDCN